MDWGDREKLLRSAKEKFGVTPRALRIKPEVSRGTEVLLQAFSLLYTGSSIPLSDIVLYCELTGFSDALRVIMVFKTLEKIVVEHNNKKLKNDRSSRR